MLRISSKGDFNKTKKHLQRLSEKVARPKSLDTIGRKGVEALASATPKDSGETALQWHYRITENASGVSIEWYNTNVNKGANVAVLIQYGHGTGTGGYVEGFDYINPAIRPIFEQLKAELIKEVRSA